MADQYRVVKGGWGLGGRKAFKEGELVSEDEIGEDAAAQAVETKRLERVPKTETAKKGTD